MKTNRIVHRTCMKAEWHTVGGGNYKYLLTFRTVFGAKGTEHENLKGFIETPLAHIFI